MAHYYEPNKADIDKALNYLRIFHSAIATPDTAMLLLETMQMMAHSSAAHDKPVDFDTAMKEVLKQLEKEQA
jgi:hypothetical protein